MRVAIVVMMLGFVPFAAVGLSASTVTGAEMLQQSELIFVGRVLDSESFRSSDGRFILTRYTFRVTDRLKGSPGSLVHLIEYGGTVGDKTLWVSHNASYRTGQEYVVFTYRDSESRIRTFAGELGQLSVISTARGDRVVQLHSSHPLAETLRDGQLPNLIPLTDFANRLQSAVQEVTQ